MREGYSFRRAPTAADDRCRVAAEEKENVTEDLYEIILIKNK